MFLLELYLFTFEAKSLIIASMMRLPEPQKNGLSVGAYCDSLMKSGYKLLGFGAFARVYHREGEDEIIKVGNDANADGYLQFVRHVGLRSKNPHFPQITSVEIFDNEPGDPYSCIYYVVRMEKLEERPWVRKHFTDHYDRREMILRRAYQEMGIEDLYEIATPCQLSKLTPRSAAMHEVKETLLALYKTHFYDLKFGNVLFRDTTLVITDPVCGPQQ